MTGIETPPPGLGPAIAVSQSSAADRRTVTGTFVAYAAIVLAFTLARGFWWPAIPIALVFAGLTVVTMMRSALAAGNDWLKVPGGRWVATAHLTKAHLRPSTAAMILELEDAGRRRLEVRLDELTRSTRLWEAFYAGLSRSVASGLRLDEQTAARLRATDAVVQSRS